ncbi:hypothetical protein CP97_13590 [Aurantiacibacter atlanticus]|uniref:HTH tetR-type domain-containing protein n=1 Tax=Aurantiacibacter atlanticus TaxID=1648404 RepID=A0A0H4VEP9_9SPHN|nr:TetR family transcriptional regulator [Aurantiacibacter atlanticus]AKQ42840.1 hypothetical protein CP97_13590 [Aurantiacibacter atlanticus]MDF1835770.1 TetR/AcrR family transcriptional regulator [Alteraurantiacibacter sp. bin_em_oilr2.035]
MARNRSEGVVDKSRADDIVWAAAALFARQGFDRTSVREIAEVVEIASGTLFYHFETKDDLLEAIIRKGIAEGYSSMQKALSRAPNGPLSRFRTLAEAHIEGIHGEFRDVHRVWIREWGRLSSQARARMRPEAHKYRELLEEILTELEITGHLRTEPAMMRHVLMPALNWTTSWANVTTRKARQQLARQICATSLNLTISEFDELLEQETLKLAPA